MLDKRGIEAKLEALLLVQAGEAADASEGREAVDHPQSETPPPPVPPLRAGGGGGKPSGMPDDPLKSRVDFLHTAFLWLAGALVVAVSAIVGVAVTLSNATNVRLDKSVETVSSLNRQVGEVSVKVDEANRRLNSIEGKIDRIVERLPQ